MFYARRRPKCFRNERKKPNRRDVTLAFVENPIAVVAFRSFLFGRRRRWLVVVLPARALPLPVHFSHPKKEPSVSSLTTTHTCPNCTGYQQRGTIRMLSGYYVTARSLVAPSAVAPLPPLCVRRLHHTPKNKSNQEKINPRTGRPVNPNFPLTHYCSIHVANSQPKTLFSQVPFGSPLSVK